jgi:hypothetical protein
MSARRGAEVLALQAVVDGARDALESRRIVYREAAEENGAASGWEPSGRIS